MSETRGTQRALEHRRAARRALEILERFVLGGDVTGVVGAHWSGTGMARSSQLSAAPTAASLWTTRRATQGESLAARRRTPATGRYTKLATRYAWRWWRWSF